MCGRGIIGQLFILLLEYHQRYLERHGHPGCAASIR